MEVEREAKPLHGLTRAIFISAFHGLLWIVLLGIMFIFVPSYQKVFTDFEVDLPVMTEWVLMLSSLSVTYGHHILCIIVVLCMVDLIILFSLYQHPQAVVLRWLWLSVMILIPLALMVWTLLVVLLPWISITESLS
ncbi:MAG: hypothetical protein JXM70_01980 [Pirellulales bacterium]|nr:hypothetical protein [Pirellulales bacterium]